MPDHVSLWGSLLKFRREFDQYINLRPVRLFDGVPCPLAGRKPGDIDYFVVRENTEGEYTNLGGVMYAGTEREFVIQESVFSRFGTDRVLRYAFELAQLAAAQAPDRGDQEQRHRDQHAVVGRPRRRGRRRTTPRSRSTSSTSTSCSARFVLQPQRFDVVVASNLFGDILSDLGPATHRHHRPGAVGQPQPRAQVPVAVRAGARLGAGHLRPEHRQPDRDDLVGRADARLPDARAGRRPRRARRDRAGDRARASRDGPRTPDLGGQAHTEDVGRAIADHVKETLK